MPHENLPPTRWEQTTNNRGYGRKFAELAATGADITGEARLADTLAPRGATILDAGCGMGRIGAALAGNGHNVLGVDLDAELLAQAKETYPELPTLHCRLDALTPDLLNAAGHATTYDLIVMVGNVMILLAEDSERDVLRRMTSLLTGEGRLIVGFHTDATPPHSRTYDPDVFLRDAQSVGLELEHRFASYDLRPFTGDGNYVVNVLRRRSLPLAR